MKKQIQKAIIILLINLSITHAQNHGSWTITDSLHEQRKNHAGVQLDNSNILITGGYTPTNGEGSNTTEIYDITSGKWSESVRMNKGRAYHNLVKLQDGSILAIGGFSEMSCEILDKEYKEWTFTDSINIRKYYGQNVVSMQNGDVLVTGGYKYTSNDTTGALKECELYNFYDKTWTITNRLNTGRYEHQSTLLENGRILVTGGKTIYNGVVVLNTCELFDPDSEEWTYATPMNYPRAAHSATLLEDGKVLVVGGQQNNCELYDPQTNQWEVVGRVELATGRNKAIKLKDEEYLLLVHDIDDYIAKMGWELYSLKNYESIYYDEFERIIWDQVVIKLDDNRVLVAGGDEAIMDFGIPVLTATNFCQVYDLNLTGIDGFSRSTSLEVISLSCYPNPFNNSTNIAFQLSSPQEVSLVVYNILGEKISIIHKGKLNTGKYTFQYDMNNYSSGIYFVKMRTPKETHFIKIMHTK
jgi:hypothetical protein